MYKSYINTLTLARPAGFHHSPLKSSCRFGDLRDICSPRFIPSNLYQNYAKLQLYVKIYLSGYNVGLLVGPILFHSGNEYIFYSECNGARGVIAVGNHS